MCKSQKNENFIACTPTTSSLQVCVATKIPANDPPSLLASSSATLSRTSPRKTAVVRACVSARVCVCVYLSLFIRVRPSVYTRPSVLFLVTVVTEESVFVIGSVWFVRQSAFLQPALSSPLSLGGSGMRFGGRSAVVVVVEHGAAFILRHQR